MVSGLDPRSSSRNRRLEGHTNIAVPRRRPHPQTYQTANVLHMFHLLAFVKSAPWR
jgi:hypothetical protein